MANLATAELWYNAGDMKKGADLCHPAHGKLPQGSADWQRAATSLALLPPLAAQQRG